MQYVFLIRSRAGGKKYVTRRPETVSIFIANLRAIFNDILRKNFNDTQKHGTLVIADVVWT